MRPSQQITVIEPETGWFSLNLVRAWQFRQLLWEIGKRDLVVRYKQTALGVLWAILQPFILMVVFSVVFGRFANMPSDGFPYPVFSYAALLPWQYFASTLTASANSVVGNSSLVTKVYFPRVILPLSAAIPGLVDFAVSFLILAGLLVYFDIAFSLRWLFLPLLVALSAMAALSVGIWLAALNVKFRDFRYTLPFLIQLMMFATPVVYPVSIFPEEWQFLLALNPMAGVVEGFRWALLGTDGTSLFNILLSCVVALTCLISGLVFFGQQERRFADEI